MRRRGTRWRSEVFCIASIASGIAIAVACSPARDDEQPPLGTGDATIDGGTETAATSGALRIEPADVSLTATLGATSGTSATVKVFEKATPSSAEVDVTAQAILEVSEGALATVATNTLTAGARGGIGTITARVSDGATGTAALHVRLIGDAVIAGFDPADKAKFGGAKIDSTPASLPAIEYPLDAVVVPSNVPPMEVQWTQAGDNTLYRVHLTAASALDVMLYTKTREALAPQKTWETIVSSVAGASVELTVEGLGATGLHVSLPVHVTVARDRIDDSVIYYWETSSGSLKVLDFATATNSTLPTKGSAYAPGSTSVCVACHTVSRDGTRIAYTSGSFGLGALKAADDKTSFDATIEPGTKVTPGFKWTYGAFNPSEKTTIPALLVTKADTTAAQNVAGHVRLSLVDPDTGLEVPSNLAEWLTSFPAGVPRDVLEPDWSAGGFVVFAAYDSEQVNPAASGTPSKAYVRDLGDDAIASAIVEAPMVFDAALKGFKLGAPKILVKPTPTGTFDTYETDVLPQISPDDAFVAFTRSKGWWPIRLQSDAVNGTGKIALVRRSDAKVLQLDRASGPDESNSTWPQWAPTVGADYAWIAFSTERPYGHRMAKGVTLPPACLPQGRGMCKNMWVTAIDRKKAASGVIDPSAVPFWMPGQTALASAVSPRWTKAALTVK